MTLPSVNAQTPAHQNNMRLVLVDDQQQPAYVKRAARLETALLEAAAMMRIEPEDMPGLRDCASRPSGAQRSTTAEPPPAGR